MKKLIVSITLLLTTMNAYAWSGNSGWHKITDIRTYNTGTAIIYIDGTFPAVNGCPSTDQYRIDDASGPMGSHIYSTALSAFVANKEVSANFTGLCTPGMNRVEVLQIR